MKLSITGNVYIKCKLRMEINTSIQKLISCLLSPCKNLHSRFRCNCNIIYNFIIYTYILYCTVFLYSQESEVGSVVFTVNTIECDPANNNTIKGRNVSLFCVSTCFIITDYTKACQDNASQV